MYYEQNLFFNLPLVSVATMSTSSKRTTSSQPLESSDPSSITAASSRFSPSSAVDRFVALQRRNKPGSPLPLVSASRQSSSEFIQPHAAKRQKHGPTSHNRAQTPPGSGDVQRRPSTHSPGAKQDRIQDQVQKQSFVQAATRIRSSTTHSSETSSPVVVRPYDALPAPSQEIHRYIASTRILQNMAIVRALLDPDCGRARLVERDVEYLRVNAPIVRLNEKATKQVSSRNAWTMI